LKDYYSILQVPVTATPADIKQAYRKLAMQYHPDKTNDDAYSIQVFAEIQEAYEVLMNPGKKELYLQERWQYKASGKPIGEELITAPTLLKKSLELNKAIAMMDIHRMNHNRIATSIITLLSDHVIEQLQQQKETSIHPSIVRTLLKATKPLTYEATLLAITPLQKLAGTNTELLREIQVHLKEKQRDQQWDRWRIVVVFIATLFICSLIYLVNH
jgi:curved DNA-binding protein CbpA